MIDVHGLIQTGVTIGGLVLIVVLLAAGFKNAPKGKNSGKGGGSSSSGGSTSNASSSDSNTSGS